MEERFKSWHIDILNFSYSVSMHWQYFMLIIF
jgi:hypothetical protein